MLLFKHGDTSGQSHFIFLPPRALFLWFPAPGLHPCVQPHGAGQRGASPPARGPRCVPSLFGSSCDSPVHLFGTRVITIPPPIPGAGDGQQQSPKLYLFRSIFFFLNAWKSKKLCGLTPPLFAHLVSLQFTADTALLVGSITGTVFSCSVSTTTKKMKLKPTQTHLRKS